MVRWSKSLKGTFPMRICRVSSVLVHADENVPDAKELAANVVKKECGDTRQDALWPLQTHQYTRGEAVVCRWRCWQDVTKFI